MKLLKVYKNCNKIQYHLCVAIIVMANQNFALLIFDSVYFTITGNGSYFTVTP